MLSLLGGAARADQLSRTDKLRVLYSNQFAFDRRGVPLITIGIAEGHRQVVIESSRPLRVLPNGEDGSEVVGGRRWKVKLLRSKAAKIEYFAVLARAPAADMRTLRPKLALWQRRGARPRLIETGTLFGVKGRVFDNRAYVLVDGPYSNDASACAAAERYVKRFSLRKVAVIPQLKQRPSGQLAAVSLDGRTRVRVRDAIWFAPSRRSAKLRVRVGGRTVARPYWGQIYVTVDRRGRLAVVNSVPADRLLTGLVPAEIFPSAPRAALRAQAVAARGDLLSKIGTRHFADPFLICAKQHCQVYRGAGHEQVSTTEAVAATKGLVLVNKHGALVKTVYSAVCGGFSENNDAVWPVKADPNLRGHIDGDHPSLAPFRNGITEANIARWLMSRPRTWESMTNYNKGKFRWTKLIPAARLNRLVRKLAVGPVSALKVLKRGVSGRAILIEIIGALGKRQVRGELRIRRLLGGLRSSMFIVKRRQSANGGVFVFHGGGWGHGVGMCQTGACGMAEHGKRYRQILRHYYPGSALKGLY